MKKIIGFTVLLISIVTLSACNTTALKYFHMGTI